MDVRLKCKNHRMYTVSVRDTINMEGRLNEKKKKCRSNMVYHFWIFGLWMLLRVSGRHYYHFLRLAQTNCHRQSGVACARACLVFVWCLWPSIDAYTFCFLYFTRCLHNSIIYRLFHSIELTWSCSVALPFALIIVITTDVNELCMLSRNRLVIFL